MNKEKFKNSNLYFIEGLSYSDNKVVLDSFEKDISIMSIEGAYTRVLEDILSLSILNNKKIVIITENDSDLDLINSDLDLLKLNIHDIYKVNFNMDVRERIKTALSNNESLIISKINLLTREIDKKLDLLKKINNFFINKDNSKLTVLDSYTMSNRKIGKCDNRYEYYKTFIEKKPFLNYSYEEIKNTINKLLDMDTSTNYNKYKRFNNNKSFDKIAKDVKIKDIINFKNMIQGILDDKSKLELKLNKTEYTHDFINAYMLNNKMSENDLNTLASNINKKYNSELINKSFKYRIINPLYWVKKKSFLKDMEECKIKYQEEEKNIFENISTNNIVITKFIDNFTFLKKILITSEYDKFILKILNEESIVDSLIEFKKTLNNYEIFTEIKLTLTSLTSLEEEILDYCYNNIGVKNQTNQLLRFIPELYVHAKIEDIENSEDEILHYYNDYEIILNDIYINLLKKKHLLSAASTSQYYKKLNEFLKESAIDNISDDKLVESSLNNVTFDSSILLSENLITNIYPIVICSKDDANKLLNSQECPYNSFILLNTTIENLNQNDFSQINVLGKTQYKFNLSNEKEEKNCIKNEMQNEIIRHLSKKGYSIARNINVSGFLFDLVVYNKKTNEIILCIECDHSVYNDKFSVEKDDVFKKLVFEEIGISYIRLWSRDWWIDRRYELNRIITIIEKDI